MKCPYCHSEMGYDEPIVMRRRFRAIHDAVAGAGPAGITIAGLRRSLPGSKSDTSLRVAVHYTNKIIMQHGQKIVRRQDIGRYVLVGMFK